MTLHAPIWQQNNTYPASRDRQVAHTVVTQQGVPTMQLGGTTKTGDLGVTQRALGANMSVDVASGRAVVLGTDVADQGKYLVHSDAVVNVPIAAAPGAGQERIDLVVAQVRDAAVIGGANNDWILTAVTGTPAAIGTAIEPATPASSLVLARILVQALVTTILNADITERRTRMGLLRRVDEARGVLDNGAFESISSSVVYGATVPVATDFVVGPVTVSADRDYRVHLHTALFFQNPAEWVFDLTVNSVVSLRLDRKEVPVGADNQFSSAAALYLPGFQTVTLGVRVDRVSGASGTVTFPASATNRRQLWIEDAGDRYPTPGRT